MRYLSCLPLKSWQELWRENHIQCSGTFGAVFVITAIYYRTIINDDFLSTVLGGILGGAGVGIVFTQGGSTGGTDIIAMIINKYKNISPGRIILYLDVFIIASSYLLFQSIEKIVYGYVTMGIASYTIDLLFTGSKQSVQMFIFSKKHDEIANRIGKELGRGITIIDGKGWYTGEQTKVLLIMLKKPEPARYSNH